MPYPAKTSAQTILIAAIEHLEQFGEESLSMRELAAKLDLTPRALYRYYPERAALLSAIAAEGFQRLQQALIQTAAELSGKPVLRAMATTYFAFAQANPALYQLLVRIHEPTQVLLQAQHDLWALVIRLVAQNLTETIDAASVAVALWAFIHGFIQLETAQIIGEEKPRSGFEVGLDIFLAGLTTNLPNGG
ncbi:MAG: TetR/AcrR family transcriptional regulator [Anaerolineae bacterium]|nr:TetR/AcrR family transcriptional regulator [Anaerolineae bacterium]